VEQIVIVVPAGDGVVPRTGNLKHPWGILIVADEKERLTPNSVASGATSRTTVRRE
jgi:hypothetical protein